MAPFTTNRGLPAGGLLGAAALDGRPGKGFLATEAGDDDWPAGGLLAAAASDEWPGRGFLAAAAEDIGTFSDGADFADSPTDGRRFIGTWTSGLPVCLTSEVVSRG